MLAQIVTENGQKKVIPLTADAGAGNPVGSYLYLEKKSNPQGYLYCDGSTFDKTKYPLLYAYLGSNVLPDWRELGAKGAEKNTTLIFDSTETDPRTGQAGTQNHDVFTQGEFKDDQFQTHWHRRLGGTGGNATYVGSEANTNRVSGAEPIAGDPIKDLINNTSDPRYGSVTRGKSRAVFIYIKATSGLSENAQDNVVAQLNEERSYSTSEINTGKKWIDGKPIYRRVFTGTASNTNQAENIATISNVSSVISVRNLQKASNAGWYENWGYARTTNEELESSAYFDIATGKLYQSHKSSIFNSQPYTIILEYTKTT